MRWARVRQPRRSLASSPGLISPRVTQRKQQKCWEGERFTKAGCRGLWDAVRTCAVACSGARLMMLLAKRGLRCPDSRLFRDLSSPGRLSGRPKTPGRAKRRVFFQKHNPHDRAKRCLRVIRLKHRCTRRPRAKHASHEAALISKHRQPRLAVAACEHAKTPSPCRTIGVESLAQPSFAALHFFAVTRLLQAKSREALSNPKH